MQIEECCRPTGGQHSLRDLHNSSHPTKTEFNNFPILIRIYAKYFTQIVLIMAAL